MYAAGMARRRTQIYLDEDVWRRIEALKRREGGTMSSFIRDAIDRRLTERERADLPLAARVAEWAGAWSNDEGAAAELEATRAELERRAGRLGY
jgi:predicted DNA-binding protein